MPIIELSHVIHPGMVTYPGLPGPEITPHLTREASTEAYAPGTTFEINRISLVGNTGTYVDSPVHRYADGADLSQLPLDRLADLPGVVISTPGPAVDRATLSVDRATLSPYPVAGHAVLVHTGWDRHFGTAAYGSPEHPYLTAEAAEWWWRIPIVEHLTGLERLPRNGFRFHAAPPLLAGMASFPVRAYAIVT